MDGYTVVAAHSQAHPHHATANFMCPERALRRAELAIYTAIAEPQFQQPIILVRASLLIGRWVGARLIQDNYADHRLLEAAVRVGLPDRQAHHTISAGLTAGICWPIGGER